jgi:hypothetical protein
MNKLKQNNLMTTVIYKRIASCLEMELAQVNKDKLNKI